MTGFYRDGYCRTGPDDKGLHTVCAVMTEEFLKFTSARGNDLSTPRPEYDFPGLKPGDRWCLCRGSGAWQSTASRPGINSSPCLGVCVIGRSAGSRSWGDLKSEDIKQL
jgi:uncharacterized protein (DUF2237 family)